MARKKKTNNPFKMWGSYIGALISIFIPQIFIISPNGFLLNLVLKIPLNILPSVLFITSILISAVGGFLIGWGIELLIRRIRK